MRVGMNCYNKVKKHSKQDFTIFDDRLERLLIYEGDLLYSINTELCTSAHLCVKNELQASEVLIYSELLASRLHGG